MLERYGEFATLTFDRTVVMSVCEVSNVGVSGLFGWSYSNRNLTFRSEDEARLGASAPHLEGRNEVKNRNGACVMEIAAMGCRAKM